MPKRGCFDLVPIAPESLAAKGTSSACRVGSVSLSLEPRIQLARHRLLARTRGPLPLWLPDSPERVSGPLQLTVGLHQQCRKRLPAELRSLAILPQFPFCQREWQNPRLASSVPAPCPDDQHMTQCRKRARVRSSHILACWQTNAPVLPSPGSRRREM